MVSSSATNSLNHFQSLLHILAHGGIALWVSYCTLWESFSWSISDCNKFNMLYSSFSESLRSKYPRVVLSTQMALLHPSADILYVGTQKDI